MSPEPPVAPIGDASPTPAQLAEVIHHGALPSIEADGGSLLVHVERCDADASVQFGFWPVPSDVAHPADPLVGYLAPTSWDALALVTSGRVHDLDDRSAPPSRVAITSLLTREGESASVLDLRATAPLVITERMHGWVADVLARALALPTPPPDASPALLYELTWLDRLAAGVLGRPTRVRSWRWMAERHPLAGPNGPVPSPDELAARTAARRARLSWHALLEEVGIVAMPASQHGPPDGRPTTPREWFDEGTLSRWLTRHAVPAELVLPDLLSVLPPHLGESLLVALVEIDPALGAAA